MMMGSEHTCSSCKKDAATFWAPRQKVFMCAACQRLYNPPYMTLIKFSHGTFNNLWNLEIGDYETFSETSEIEICGWFVRSKQETLFSLVPKTTAIVYHMEYHGDEACGRCVSYKYFESGDECLAMACKKFAKPFRPAKDITYPPQKSRYVKWMGL